MQIFHDECLRSIVLSLSFQVFCKTLSELHVYAKYLQQSNYAKFTKVFSGPHNTVKNEYFLIIVRSLTSSLWRVDF